MSSEPSDPTESESERPVKREQDGRFAKGHRKLGGRKLGTPNVSTEVLEALIHGIGETEEELAAYVKRVADKDPRTAVKLLCRLLPKITLHRHEFLDPREVHKKLFGGAEPEPRKQRKI
jgi:hypothetical protein